MPKLGRYEIDRRIGRGGMGEVYRGLDPQLGRRVAIKRMREDVVPASEHGRLLDEARALARLSHPNVVQIYEVGVHEDRAYVAMEYVEGQTLREWGKREHGWQEILAVHVAAGRGLAAAHAAGLVHRDFKPDNVLIGDDQRVRVLDFGLALTDDVSLMASELGSIAGTVRYMSAEQLRGEVVDGRSDQFSFCAVLCEALWGEVPFGQGDVKQRLAALERDQLQRPSKRGVPRGLWAPIRRGLHHDPAQRWASLDALLDVLAGFATRRRLGITAAVALPLALAAGLTLRGEQGPACADVASELDWSVAGRDALVRTIAAVEVPHARDTAARVGRQLDDWAASWSAARREQCEAASSRRDTPELASARRRCLEDRRDRFASLIGSLRAADVDVIDHALAAVTALPDASTCTAADVLDETEPPTAAQREAVDRLQRELAALQERRSLGRADPSAAATTLARAQAVGHRPTIVDAQAELGHAHIEAGSPARGLTHLAEAADLALGIGDRRRFATITTQSVTLQLSTYPSPAAPHLLQQAEAAWLDLDPEPRMQTLLAFGHGRVESGAAAREWFERGLETAMPSQRPALLGALAQLTEGDEALRLHARARDEAEQVFGPLHPETAVYLFNLGITLRDRGEHEQARVVLERAASVWMRAHGRPHPNLMRAHLLLAEIDMQGEQLDRAEQHARAVVDIAAATLPSGHHDLGLGPMLLARIASLRGDRGAALRWARRAIDAYTRADGPRSYEVLEMRLDAASSLTGLGWLDAAEREYEATLALADDASLRAIASLGLAELELQRGALERTRARLDEVTAIGVDRLGDQRISYAVLDGLVTLRSGCRDCAPTHAARIAEILHALELSPGLLEPWLDELAASEAERRLLGLQ